MGIEQFYAIEGEKPFDNFFPNGGFTGIFRTIACIGDSLSSGEHESMMDGKKGFHIGIPHAAGGIEAGIQSRIVAAFEKFACERRLQEGFAAGQRNAAVLTEIFAVTDGFFRKFLRGGFGTCLAVPGIGIVAASAAEIASLQERNKPNARPIKCAEGLN